MVETITPAVHGGRRRRYGAAVALHLAGAAGSAGALGAALGAAGAALGAPWGRVGAGAVGATAVFYALGEAGLVRAPTPAARRQVPEWWRTFFSPQAAALFYGLGLGVGFATFLSHGTFVAVCVAALASGDPAAGALLCAAFGLARAASAALGGATNPAAWVDRLDAVAASRLPRVVNGAALLAVGAAAISSLSL